MAQSYLRTWVRRAIWVDYFLLILRIAVVAVVAFGSIHGLLDPKYALRDWFVFMLFGLTMGGVYALVALGYTMVYGTLRMINMAHGDVMMVGAYGGMSVASVLADQGVLAQAPVLTLPFIFLAAIVCSVLLSLLVERIASRPFLHVRSMTPLICSIGISFGIEYSVRGMFGTRNRAYPPMGWLDSQISLLGVNVPVSQIVALSTAVAMMVILTLVVKYSNFGKSIRAVAEDRDAAALVGIDVGRVIVLTFALGGVMAGVGGVIFGIVFKQIQVFMGFSLGIKAFAAAILGGIGNLPGAMLGGLLLGLAEAVGPALFLDGLNIPAPYQLRDIIAFGMLVLVLIFRSQGLFGEQLSRKRA